MKKIILSLAVIVVVSTAVVGITRAYFTSTATSSGNTFSAGTLHIRNMNVDWMAQVDFSNLKPGDLVRKWVRIENDSTLDIGTLTVSAVNVNDPSGLLHQLTGWTYGGIAGTSDDPNGVQTGFGMDGLALLNNADLLSPANHVLHPGQHATIQVQFVMPTSLGNEWQGKTATLDLQFNAEQVH